MRSSEGGRWKSASNSNSSAVYPTAGRSKIHCGPLHLLGCAYAVGGEAHGSEDEDLVIIAPANQKVVIDASQCKPAKNNNWEGKQVLDCGEFTVIRPYRIQKKLEEWMED